MSFKINKIIGSDVQTIACDIRRALAQSRFSASVETPSSTRIEIRTVRLNESKDYCGNHPYACPVRPGGHAKHRRLAYLEGADWVAFNDMLNDVLDALDVSANVASSLCIIRKGALRRTEYKGHKFLNGIDSEWDKDTTANHYVDRRNRISSRSLYPKDTPGIDCWKEKEVDSRPAMLHTH